MQMQTDVSGHCTNSALQLPALDACVCCRTSPTGQGRKWGSDPSVALESDMKPPAKVTLPQLCLQQTLNWLEEILMILILRQGYTP